MQLIDFFIRNPVKVSVAVLLTALFGVISMVQMPKQLAPEVTNPVLTIETRWPGAGPQEVEREIVIEQEEQLQSVEGLVEMTSECLDSSARITLEFNVGTNIEDAMLRVNTRLQQVRQYPVDAQEPVISASSISDRPIARFVLTARPPEPEVISEFAQRHPECADMVAPALRAMNTGLRVYRLQDAWRQHGAEHPELAELQPPDLNLEELRKFSEDVIETRLERVSGVSDAYTYGGQEQELQVTVDPDRLAARQLTITDVRNALRNQNKDTSGGDLWEGKRRYVIRTLSQFRSPEQVREQVLAVRDGTPIMIGDVAEVALGFKKTDSVSRRYGISSNGLAVNAASGANVLNVMEGIRAATVELNDGVLRQRGLELSQYYDETSYIHASINLVRQNIVIGGALTMIVLLLFLHPGLRTAMFVPLIAAASAAAAFVSPEWVFALLCVVLLAGAWFGRGALVVALAIPVSIVGTFLLLGLMGRSLNVISLAGLAFAVGMLVDNAVVVLENIFRRYQSGESPQEAAVRGTKEVWGAVTASTLTTIAVFVPVLFVQQTAGQLFRDIALAIACAVGLSMVVSFTVVPTAASRLFGENRRDSAESRPSVVTGWIRSIGRLFVTAVTAVTRFVIGGNVRAFVVTLLMVAAAVTLSWKLLPELEYLPSGNRNFVFCSLSPPPGYNMDELMQMGMKIEQDLEPYWNADPGSPEAEALEYPLISYYFYVVRGRQVFMGFEAADDTRTEELIPLVRSVGSQFPGTLAVARRSSLFSRGLTGGRSIDIEITGPDLEQLVAIGGQVMNKVSQVLPEAQAMPRPSLDLAGPEIHVVPKLMEASEMGVNASDLGYTVDALVDGAYAGDYFVGGETIDLTIRAENQFIRRTQDLNALPISTAAGRLVPLSAVAEVIPGSGPEQINRRERQRVITIGVSPPDTMPLEAAMDTIRSEVIGPMEESDTLNGGYMLTLTGTADKLREAWLALRWNLLLALAITYLLMAALFESWLYPFVIIFSVPLGAVGGILALSFLNLFIFQPLDVLTMLGFVILIGTVVNNAILIVHQSLNHIRDDRMEIREAVARSVETRIRPIFITTLTTVLGLLPLVAFPGAGSELYRGLGAVVLGGLLVSTVFTLFLVPAVFVLCMDLKQLLVRLLRFDRFRRPAYAE